MRDDDVAAPGDADPVVAEFAVEHPDSVLGDSLRAAPDVTVEPNYRTADERSSLLVFTVTGGSLDEFDAALATDHTVRDQALLDATTEGRAYRVRYAPETLRLGPVFAALGALVLDARTEDRAWTFRVRFPSRAAFAAFRDFCTEHDATLRLFKLFRDAPSGGDGALGLTASQWETLTVAHEMGYFEVPRGATQAQLARRLDVSPSAVSQRMRRATNRLLTAALESGQFGPGI